VYLPRMRGERGFLAKMWDRDANYRLLRVKSANNATSVIMRLVGRDGFNYHEFLLKNSGGTVTAFDIFVYYTAEFFSESTRRWALWVARESETCWRFMFDNPDVKFVSDYQPVKEMLQHQRAGRHAEVLAAYNRLPADAREDKTYLAMRLQAARNLGADVMAEVANDVERWYPHDPCFDFWFLDHYMLAEEHDAALACLDRIDQRVGGDRYLKRVRSRIRADRSQALARSRS
jgi:hypothetical protein